MRSVIAILILIVCGCDLTGEAPILDFSSLPDPDCKTAGELCEVDGFCRLISGSPLFCDGMTTQFDDDISLGIEISEEQIVACAAKKKLDSCNWEGICRAIGDNGDLQCSF